MIRYRKIGPNNVVKETVLFDAESNGNEVVVDTQSYGQDRIDKEMASAVLNEGEWALMDAGQYGVDKQNEYQLKIDEITLIQEVMNG